MRSLPAAILFLSALAGLLTACGGGGGGGGTAPVDTVDPPVITTQPVSDGVLVGETATFTVAATGEGTLTYQWQRSVNGGGSWTNLGGATGTSYTTPAATLAEDGDEYRCIVSNAGGSTTSVAASLVVTPIPPYRHTITIDGGNDFLGEESFVSTGDGVGFVTWDEDYLYVGMDSPLLVELSSDDWAVIYLGGGSGTTTGVAYGPQQPALPFSARYHVRARADRGVIETLEWNGSAWTDAAWDFTGDWMAEETFFEVRIPLADIGDPTTIRLHLCFVSDRDMEENTTVGVPDTSFTSGLDPDFTAWYEFDYLGTEAPNTYVPRSSP